MICRHFFSLAPLVLVLGYVHAGWDGNPEGDTGSGIQTVDTDQGFNVTDSGGNFTILTSYLFNKCSAVQKTALKQAVSDANEIAYAGVKQIARPGAAPDDWVDFTHEAAIDYFGPSSKNKDQQSKIYTTLTRASYAYRGWGWSDWWSNRYVELNCDGSLTQGCAKGNVLAITSNGNKQFGYPLITFCDIYFSNLPSFDTVIKNLDSNNAQDRRVNVVNLRNQGSTMLHEWIHMNWGSAEVCPGGATDNIMYFGPDKERTKAYRPGRAKLLAKRNVQAAANNNDNYVFYSLSWFMLRRYGKYPEYPTAWDPSKSVADNQAAEGRQPGAPPANQVLDNADELDDDNPDGGPEINDPLYAASEYPDWYRPIVTASLPITSPATLPSITPPPTPTEPPSDAPTIPMDEPTSSPAPPQAQSSAAPPPPPPPDADSCDVSYKFLFDSFEVRGKNFDSTKFGNNGDGLQKQIKGCGDLTHWSFKMTPNDPTYQWYASGRLPIGTKACVGRAVVSAGGANDGNCHGAG